MCSRPNADPTTAPASSRLANIPNTDAGTAKLKNMIAPSHVPRTNTCKNLRKLFIEGFPKRAQTITGLVEFLHGVNSVNFVKSSFCACAIHGFE
jgi:hypothetical protein